MNDYRVQRHSSLLYLLMVLLLALPGWAQDEDEDPAMTGECIPAELTVPYDTLSLEGNSEQQIAIWYDYAREYFKKAKYENKEDQYHQSIPYFWMVALSDKSGRFRVVYSRLAEAYSALNEIDSTLIVVYRGLKKYPDYSVLHYHAGQIHRVRGNLECAIPHYQALLADVGTDAQAQKRYLEILARLYYELGDERCIETQKKLTDLDPENESAKQLLVRMYEEFGIDSIKLLEEIFLSDSLSIIKARSFGIPSYEAGNYRNTIRAFKSVLQTDPKNIEAYEYIARAYEGLGNLRLAQSYYERILKVDSKHINAYCSLASVSSRQQQFKQASSYISRALQIDPNAGLAYMVLGEVYENAVSHCSESRSTKGYRYDDKLVYEKAREAYRQAYTRDSSVAIAGKNRYEQLASFIRSREDTHMYNNRTEVTDPCYSWIK